MNVNTSNQLNFHHLGHFWDIYREEEERGMDEEEKRETHKNRPFTVIFLTQVWESRKTPTIGP